MTSEQQPVRFYAPGIALEAVDERLKRVAASAPTESADHAFKHLLRVLRAQSRSLGVEVLVTDQSLPVFNDPWNRLKRVFHELTVMYVNQLAGKIAGLWDNVALTLGELETRRQTGQAELERLTARVEALERQLADLERTRGRGGSTVIRRIHQVVPRLSHADAVGNQILACQRLLRAWGYESEIFADSWDPQLQSQVRSTAAYAPGQADTLMMLHYCSCGAANDWTLQLPEPVAIYYHNITPARFFRSYDPHLAQCLAQAREQLPRFAARCPAIAASPYNQQELDGLGFKVIGQSPYFVWLDALQEGAQSAAAQAVRAKFEDPSVTTWLYVGRMAPNKAIEDVILAFDHYHREYAPDSRLLLVGRLDGTPSYGQMLQDLVQELPSASAITFTGPYGAASGLGAFFQLADVYVSLSEHEGYCVPLIEAMSFDIPVLAYAATGVPGTLGESGVQVHDKRPAVVAAAVHELVRDPALKRAVVGQQARRLVDHAPERAEAAFRAAIDRLVMEHRA